MGTYLILNQDYIENTIVADDDASASLAATDGRTFVQIYEFPPFPIIGKKYINGEYVEINQEQTAEI